MNLIPYFTVMGIASFKFMFGPITGLAMGLAWYESFIFTICGMMLTNTVLMVLNRFRQQISAAVFSGRKKKSPFNKRNRLAIKIRQGLGLWGIAFLTPVLFTPPIGAILALAFRYERKEILFKMFVSALAWGSVFVFFFYYLNDLFFN